MEQEFNDYVENRINIQNNELDNHKFINMYYALLNSLSTENKELLEILYDNFNNIVYEEKIKAYKMGFIDGIYISKKSENN